MRLQRRRERVEPMDGADEIFERSRGRDVLDAQGDDRDPFAHRPLDLAPNLRRVVGVCREDQDQHAAMVDAFDNRLAPFRTRHDVARRDPTANPGPLQGGTGGVCGCLVVGRVADECVVRHLV